MPRSTILTGLSRERNAFQGSSCGETALVVAAEYHIPNLLHCCTLQQQATAPRVICRKSLPLESECISYRYDRVERDVLTDGRVIELEAMKFVNNGRSKKTVHIRCQ